MTDIADAVVDVLAGLVADLIPGIAAKVPPGPAAELGRIGLPPDEARPGAPGVLAAVARARARGGPAESPSSSSRRRWTRGPGTRSSR